MPWESLAAYKEFIINGLDLASGLLMAPEVTAAFAPGVFAYLYVVYYNFFTVVAAIVILWHVNLDSPAEKGIGFAFMVVVGNVLGRWSRDHPVTFTDQQKEQIKHYAFWSGVILFVISRTIAFLLAAHELKVPAHAT